MGKLIAALGMAGVLLAPPASAGPFSFSTGNPDGKIATLSRTPGAGGLETETADDFVTTVPTRITAATFIGLLPEGAALSSVISVEVELYHVFPLDSAAPDGRVVTRTNSPSDNNFAAADSALGQLTFTTTLLNPSFTAANSVVNGIHAAPNQTTGGEGAVTGEEVEFDLTFTPPFVLGGPDHVFFRPEVDLSSGNFLWLSAPKPIVAPGTPFPPGTTDLQSWIRNDGPGALAPDWERIGTDVVGGGMTAPAFNAAFSLFGQTIPEPGTLALLGLGLAGLALRRRVH